MNEAYNELLPLVSLARYWESVGHGEARRIAASMWRILRLIDRKRARILWALKRADEDMTRKGFSNVSKTLNNGWAKHKPTKVSRRVGDRKGPIRVKKENHILVKRMAKLFRYRSTMQN